ncbi:MAG: rod shape-determining protein [Candidatus Jacksonbacteria bacterium RIFOXYC2_FULL_44_29]|nr:MAG: Rod shape-determining protein MreB [Parcubacteria group bacterium GW2011_GWC2_44_22]OGY75739.1 MAG: rod shape-determining protein [Candidatus Jacksonbacteria bacterium RIFOXYA2_FULL_43_12]OGY76305.1 MAG: rod shape-determining protein [Candidatus Jacksonbacteria bacterium RIFOXYB2_FULL_44_15]OGY78131.1 MAG: rod shape-determining protein [Candidatus Jacksonbacteria bacterium RIFOXYC2_FULL_44_29]OGY80960.1 MAG: rod shape-determining protein [Candidatus Jacksonbacteria bacterium RIFOXYD2_FU
MFLDRLFGQLSKDIGIDLGTANTLVYVKDKGIVINEPSVVAINNRTEEILAVGDEARKMMGKTPAHITAIKPLRDGVISDFEVTEKMLKYFINKTHRKEHRAFVPRPRIIIGLPMEVTEVERKAVEDATLSAGAREVFLIEEPMAAAIGARIPIHEPHGFMIVDVGGGTTEIAVISLGGIVTKKSLPIAGDEFNESILNFVRENFNILIGEPTAENAKIRIGSVLPTKEIHEYIIRGRNLLDGLPTETVITNAQIREAILPSINAIVENIINTLESTPPELAADIHERGIYLAGGGALLHGLDKLISLKTKVPVTIVDDPLTTVARGTGLLLEDMELLHRVRLPSSMD